MPLGHSSHEELRLQVNATFPAGVRGQASLLPPPHRLCLFLVTSGTTTINFSIGTNLIRLLMQRFAVGALWNAPIHRFHRLDCLQFQAGKTCLLLPGWFVASPQPSGDAAQPPGSSRCLDQPCTYVIPGPRLEKTNSVEHLRRAAT